MALGGSVNKGKARPGDSGSAYPKEPVNGISDYFLPHVVLQLKDCKENEVTHRYLPRRFWQASDVLDLKFFIACLIGR